MPRVLPSRPNLEHLKKQAKDLLRDLRQGDLAAAERLRTGASLPRSARPTLTEAQRAVALEYGFASWSKLKAHVASLTRESDPAEALAAAVRAGDVGRVVRVLKRHPDLRARLDAPMPHEDFGATPLIGAARHGNRELVDALLRAGADINARSHWWAGGFGVLDDDHGLASFLIERGATVDVHAAARLGLLPRLEELLASHPELVHARGGDGQTPLHFAATVEVARLLLDHGAEIDARDVDHESTPAQYMVRDRPDVASLLIARGCQTDVLMAAALGDLALVRRHLEADPACVRMRVSESYFPKRDPRSGGTIYIWVLGWHKSAHQVARDFGHDEVARLLWDRSPEEAKLAMACELGDESLVQAMLEARPHLVESLSAEDRRRVADAAQLNDTGAVRMMLAAGWPAEVRGQNDGTALHWAAWHGNVAMVREILRHDAPPEARGDRWDQPPLGWACHGSLHGWHQETSDYPGTVQALLAAGARVPDSIADLEASEAVLAVLRRRREGIG